MEPREEIDEGDEDADVPLEPEPATIERLPDVGGWEHFKVIDGGEEIRTVSIRLVLQGKSRSIDFAIFHDMTKEPVETGSAKLGAADAAPLEDASRVRLLGGVLKERDPDFARYGGNLDFAFTRPRDDDHEHDDEEDD